MKLPQGGVSPLAISLMLTCYWSPNPGKERADAWSTPAGSEIKAWLIAQGLIDAETWRATERGKAWVGFICATPVPVAKWELPEWWPPVTAVVEKVPPVINLGHRLYKVEPVDGDAA